MNQFIQKIPEVVLKITFEEEVKLKQLGKGIFYMPELAFTYKLGKELAQFGQKHYNNFNWNREVKVGNEGPSDLVFDINDEKIVVEVKMSNTIDSYLKDIDKLNRIEGTNVKRIFITLIDSFRGKEETDLRIVKMNKLNLKPLKVPFDHFEIEYSEYNNPISCVIGIWKVV